MEQESPQHAQPKRKMKIRRRHARLQLPVTMQIRGVVVDIVDWSHSGVSFSTAPLRAQKTTLAVGEVIEGVMLFNFDGFALQMPVSCEVRHVDAGATRAGCHFRDMKKRNMAIMQYLVSAYMAGELIQVGDILDVASRRDAAHLAPKAGEIEEVVVRPPPCKWCCIVALFIALLIIAGNLYLHLGRGL